MNTVVGHAANSTNADGVWLDDVDGCCAPHGDARHRSQLLAGFSAERLTAISAATNVTVARAERLLHGAGKWTFNTPNGFQNLPTPTNVTSQCVSALEAGAALAHRPTVMYVDYFAPEPSQPTTAHDFRQRLAAFLLVRGDYSFFGHGWITSSPPVWYPEYDWNVGVPLEPMSRNGSTFVRRWTNVTVKLDCASFKAAFDFKTDDVSATTQPALPHMLSIDWQRLPDLLISKSGFQNSDGGWVSPDEAIAAFGHGHGSTPFLNTAYKLNVTAAAASKCRGSGGACDKDSMEHWRKLPSAPVDGRQDVASAVIDGAVYILGGFSYTAPYSYSDFLRLGANATSGGWDWRRLPSFPYPVAMHAVASISSKLYVQGGACYDRVSFSNWVDCTGGTPGLGKRLYEFDVTDEPRGWQRLPDNPGPPRANAALSSVRGSLFVIGGNTFVSKAQGHRTTTSMTLVDNWRYDPGTRQWSRLADLPVASGNFQTNGVKW